MNNSIRFESHFIPKQDKTNILYERNEKNNGKIIIFTTRLPFQFLICVMEHQPSKKLPVKLPKNTKEQNTAKS